MSMIRILYFVAVLALVVPLPLAFAPPGPAFADNDGPGEILRNSPGAF